MLSIEEHLSQALRGVVQADVPEAALRWEIPKDATFGDLSNAVFFKLAGPRKQSPQRIAEELSAAVMGACRTHGLGGWIARVEPKAGFLNVFLSDEGLVQVLRDILRQGSRFGTRVSDPAPSLNLEFVSANPTGPLSVAHGRQAAVGDALARLLRSQGTRVVTEYYLNDEGRQIELLGQSLRARYLQQLGEAAVIPEGGYHGGDPV